MPQATGFNIAGNTLSIGNQGLTGEETVALAKGIAEAQQNAATQFEVQERQERERRLILTVGATTATGLFLLIFYLISKNNQS